MDKLPEKTCTIDRLLRHPRLIALALAGRKHEQRRDGVYGYPGERFTLKGVEFEITGLARQAVSEMRDEDARAEGFADLERYWEFIVSIHSAAMERKGAAPGRDIARSRRGMGGKPEGWMWVHRFRRVEG